MILSIDPGPLKSAYCMVRNADYKPLDFGLIANDELMKIVKHGEYNQFVIECIASYGMAVGKETFETCYWIGRYMQAAVDTGFKACRIYRKDEKLCLCGSMRAKDTNITHALIDRFAQHDFKSGKGTIKNPDWFYGFKKDIWAAYAVGVTFLDSLKGLYTPK